MFLGVLRMSASASTGCRESLRPGKLFVLATLVFSDSFHQSVIEFLDVDRINTNANRPNWPYVGFVGTEGNARKISVLVLSQAGSGLRAALHRHVQRPQLTLFVEVDDINRVVFQVKIYISCFR